MAGQIPFASRAAVATFCKHVKSVRNRQKARRRAAVSDCPTVVNLIRIPSFPLSLSFNNATALARVRLEASAGLTGTADRSRTQPAEGNAASGGRWPGLASLSVITSAAFVLHPAAGTGGAVCRPADGRAGVGGLGGRPLRGAHTLSTPLESTHLSLRWTDWLAGAD